MVTRTVSRRYAVQHATATTAAARSRSAAGGVPSVITRMARATRTAGTTATSRATTLSRTTISATCRVSASEAGFAMGTSEYPPFGCRRKTVRRGGCAHGTIAARRRRGLMAAGRVVVIGAGVAGLTAALAMSRNGAEVLVVDRD